ncbi:MAG: recombinase family protein [Alphaproteobacteria bacterium]
MRYVTYFRVSTERQGQSGLGLEAQKYAVAAFATNDEIVESFTEIESGKNNDRPELNAAIETTLAYGAKLLVAKLDRLTRDPAFLYKLRDSGVDFICADMPEANKLTIGILALVAEQEREAISQRTKAGLAAAKARGVKLGNPQNLSEEAMAKGRALGRIAKDKKMLEGKKRVLPIVERLHLEGVTTGYAVAKELNRLGIPTVTGKGIWRPETVPLLETMEA